MWENGIPLSTPTYYIIVKCVLEEIQEPDRKKFGKSNSNDVLGFLKDFVNQQEQKNEKEAERREKMHDEKLSAMNKLIDAIKKKVL